MSNERQLTAKQILHGFIDGYVALVAKTCGVTEDEAAQVMFNALMRNAVDISEMIGAEIKEDET